VASFVNNKHSDVTVESIL